ncbi:MAG: DUF559 domain-containing protein, partial [Bifidobacterium sp.]
SSAAAHVRLNQACRRPTVYPHFFAHNRGYPLIHCFSNAYGQRPTNPFIFAPWTMEHNILRVSRSCGRVPSNNALRRSNEPVSSWCLHTARHYACKEPRCQDIPINKCYLPSHALATDNNARTHLQNVQFELWTGPIIETATLWQDSPYGSSNHMGNARESASQEELITLGDSMLRRNQRFPQVCIDDFHEYLERLKDFSNYANANRQRPIRGIRKMQHALQLMREGTDSSQESRCRIALIRNGLPCPKVNWKVRLNNGQIALLDMAYPDIKVAIEYDGRHHAGQWLADSKRREALEDDGWAYIQVTAENLMNDFEERALAQRVADRMSRRLSKPIMLCQRMSSGRIHIRITSLANGSRKILI